MEEFSISLPEHKILNEYRRRLEKCFDVLICLPEINYDALLPTSIEAIIIGAPINISYVKKFMEKELNMTGPRKKKKPAKEVKSHDSIPVITLSDDENDLPESQETSPMRKENSILPISESNASGNESVSSDSYDFAAKNINSASGSSGHPTSSAPVSRTFRRGFRRHKSKKRSVSSNLASKNYDAPLGLSGFSFNNYNTAAVGPSGYFCQSVTMASGFSSATQNPLSSMFLPVLPSPSCTQTSSSQCNGPSEAQSSTSNDQNADDGIVILSEVIVSSTSVEVIDEESPSVQKETAPSSVNNSTAEGSRVSQPLPDFIPLRVRNCQPQPPKKSNKRKRKDSVEPALKEKRVLRPIVIDGSNVARQHGKHSNTFSCKGIKLCVDYFLQRGHTDIKVLLPHFRKYISTGPCVTTDSEYLDVLEASNMVVYTPSRRVNDRRITCYDDRFIVSLAAKTNGVIVSNDHYRDILGESDEFKKTINERLLMFCFAGDILMIPEDPLGSKGPTLDNFLSMRVEPTH